MVDREPQAAGAAAQRAQRATDEAQPHAAATGAEPPVAGAEAPARAGHDPSLMEIGRQLIDDVRGAVQARFHLLTLEARRAGLALTMMALYAVLAALLAVTAWVCGWVLAIALAMAAGLPFGVVLGIALVISAVGVWLLLRMARAEAQHLLFPATVRQLAPSRTPEGDRGPSPAQPPGATAGPASAAR
jgi:uncharacterized membrane protein YqjE